MGQTKFNPNQLPIGYRNLLIDGGFTINQREYVSGATLATTVYGHDRWKAGSGGGDYSFTQLASPTEITIAANKTLIQVVEDKNVYGGTYILSWEGTCQGRYAVDSATPAGAYADSPIIITGQTAGATMSVEFGNGASSGTLGKVQLELGSIATQFEFRHYSAEKSLCEWYLYVIAPEYDSTHLVMLTAYITSVVLGGLFTPKMRIAPDITVLNPTNITVVCGGTIVSTNITLVVLGRSNGAHDVTVTSTSTPFTDGRASAVRINATVRIYFSAEL